MSTDVDNFLAHYGVKGMRWGVIRKDPSGPPPTKTRDLPDSEKSKIRIRYEAGYIGKGHTPAQAKILADRRLTTEKVLATVGGMAVAAAISYAATSAITKRFVGVTLAEGTSLNYVNAMGGDKVDLDRRLYTTFKKGDGDKYRGMLAARLRNQAASIPDGSRTVYDTVLKTTKEIKAPSQVQAAKMYKEFVKANGIINAPSYRMMNRNIVFDDPTSKQFLNHLKTKGYNAILDANDQFISGYNTKAPLVIFNAASSTVKSGEKILKNSLIDKLNTVQTLQVLGRQMAPVAAVGAAIVGINKNRDGKTRYSLVEKYIKDNPNTKKSYAEIYNSIKLDRKGQLAVTLKS